MSTNRTTTPPTIKQRVFVVGCSRSGTTLLQSILAAHPDVTSFPETQFFNDTVGQEPRRVFGQKPQCREHILRYFIDDCRVWFGRAYQQGKPAQARADKLLEYFDRQDLAHMIPRDTRSMAKLCKAFANILDTLTADAGKTIWVEKSPRHLNCIDIIERFVPKPKFIHIVRAGQDNVASLHGASKKYPSPWHWGQFSDIDRCITRWNIAARQTKRNLNKPNHHAIRHEWLVQDAQPVVQDICRFIGVEFDPQMTQPRETLSDQMIKPSESWKSQSSGEIKNTNAQKFYDLFDKDQQGYITSRLEPLDGPLSLERSHNHTR